MAYKGWYSKQDVIKDLSKATGTYVSDLDEEYVVVGEQPPPLYRTADDEENLQLLRLYGGHQPSSSNNTDMVKPDLEGITQMLRMVDEYNDSPVNNRAKETKKQETNTVITISKLNPNVAEFVPRSDNGICNKDNAIVANNELLVSEVDKEKHNHRTRENKSTEACDRRPINTLSNKSISIKDSDEIKEMKEKLKSKITNTFNTSCVKVRKERNLAIAMLVKLHTQPNNEINNDGQKPKLMTPDYFKTSFNHDAKLSDSNISSNTNTNSNTPLASDDSIHQAVDIDMCKDLLTNTKQSDDIMERESPVYDNLNDSYKSVMAKEIKESIQKVDNWLNPKINAQNKTSATTRPSLYLGPITFKRKNNSNSKPMSLISVESELKSQNSIKNSEVFVPSTFASELTKKYEERNKTKDNQVQSTNQDIWTKLESDLKVRDEIIKKKRLQTNAD